MPAEVKNRLFEPFFTTKNRSGLGLGLWVGSEIVKKHKGSISIRTSQARQRHGTVVRVFLPSSITQSSLSVAA
jgi:signal transduction histidine kinase